MWPSYSERCIKAVTDTLRHGGALSGYRSNKAWGVGPQSWSWAFRFERELEARFRVRHAIAVNSGTMALKAALFALNLPPGSEVITTPFSFSATPASIVMMGHTPVFVDVSPTDFTIDPEKVKKAITKKTAAIMPVDLFGGLANYEALEKLGLPIISDHCQAVGAEKNGRRFFGTIGANSGNGGKNLPLGEGGWAMTDDKKLAERMRLYISHAENFGTDWVGDNGRMPEMTACIGYHGLLDLEARNQRRRLLADVMRQNRFYHDDLERPWPKDEESHVWYVYPFVISQERKRFIQRMKRKGIAVSPGYIDPHLAKYKALRKYVRAPLPVVAKLSQKTLCILPCLTPDKDVAYAEHVAKSVKDCLE